MPLDEFSTDLVMFLGKLEANNGKDRFDASRARHRAAPGDRGRAEAFLSALGVPEAAGYALDEPHLRRVPSGFDADEAPLPYLGYKGIVVRRRQAQPEELFTAAFGPVSPR